MTATLGVPEDMHDALKAFVDAEGMDLEVASSGECSVQVVRGGSDMRSDLRTLYAGGWIACATGTGLALKLGVPPGQIGRLIDHLGIKVRQCELGLF